MGLFFNGNQLTPSGGLAVRGGSVPSLFRDWGTFPVLDHGTGPAIEFSRGSTATFTGSNGLIQSAATNAPRFDYDPVTLACRGLLIEEQRTNLLTFSEQFDNAAWSKGNMSITANAAIAPDGTTTADKLVEDNSNNEHGVWFITTAPDNTTYVASCYLKAAERNWARVNIQKKDSNRSWANINLNSGLIGRQGGVLGFQLTNANNGWYRLSVVANSVTGLAGFRMSVIVLNGDSSVDIPPYTGDGTSGVFIWGAQLEAGAFATSYIPTTTATVTRSADVAQISGSNFSSMYNQNEGTLFYSAIAGNSGIYFYVCSAALDLKTANRNLDISKTPFQRHEFAIMNSNTLYNSTNRNWISGLNKGAMGYGGSSFSASVNGSIDNVASVVIPTNINNLKIGSRSDGTLHLNGTISRLAYYRTRLTDAQLQSLTA